MEEYVEIPSDSGITFNVKPKIKALEIAGKATDAILNSKFDQVRVNLPNSDMMGHTGDIEATVVACKAADEAVKMIIDAIEQVGGIYVVTADHGNAEDMVKRTKAGQPPKKGTFRSSLPTLFDQFQLLLEVPDLHQELGWWTSQCYCNCDESSWV